MPRRLALQPLPGDNPPAWLPVEIAAQPPLARRAYAMLLAKPGRSLASIARELGSEPRTIVGFSRAGRWARHLADHLSQSKESLLIAAEEEARRSRAAALGANRIFEGAIEASLQELIEVNQDGQVVLKAGATVADVEKLARARQTHVKTTMLITGEAAANAKANAVAGATRVVLGVDLKPQPLPATGRVVSS